jgi:hypothetical protein
MATSPTIPCIKLPSGKDLKVSLPLGVELKSMVDLSKGPPTDCALIHSLMLQLMPALGGMACFLKLITVIQKALDVINSGPSGFFTGLPKLATAVEDFLSSCLPTPVVYLTAVKDILLLIIAYLECFIESVESVLKFQVGIDLNSASGNPVLLASLSCAQDNNKASMDQMMQATAVIQPILQMIKPFMDMAHVSFTMPSLSNLAGAQDLTQALDNLHSTLEQLKQVVEAIP